MANVTETGLPQDFRREFVPPHRARKTGSDFDNRVAVSAADIEYAAVNSRLLKCRQEGAGNVGNMDEIAALQPVLEYERTFAV
jgi:hypothetical protein